MITAGAESAYSWVTAGLKHELAEQHAAEKNQMREDAMKELDAEREKLLDARK